MADPLASSGRHPDPRGPSARPRPGPAPEERRRALVTCLWLASATLLGGIDLPALGYSAFRFAPFGLVAGLLGLLYVFVLVHRDVIWKGTGWIEVLLLVYWTAATATMFRVLLPAPGLVQVGLVLLAVVAAALLAARPDRHRAVLGLAIVAVVLAVLRFALVPVFEGRSGLPDWGPLRLGGAADAVRDVFMAYAPQRPATQAVHFAALACYALALRAQWREDPGPADGVSPG